ncbi:MAG: succinate-semialdehyde dehydrogenase [Oceanobacter sp.]|nr:MAG: succinate-semialdehyde dehydrogenase [Oceanobacter sp.]
MLTPMNPTTGSALTEVPSLSSEQASALIDSAVAAAPAWAILSYKERGQYLLNIAELMRKNKDELARLMAEEMGKPLREGLGEVEKAASCAEYYADNGEAFLASEFLQSDARDSYVCHQPLGTVLGILPWNAPVWLALRFLGPALMSGNTCVMKPDPNVPATATLLTQVFQQVLPAGVMENLMVKTELVGEAIDHPGIKAISFTGSSQAGRKVAARAASGIKPAVLELGGSDPCIVLADADIGKACDVITLSRLINAGQSCIAVKRVIVEANIYEQVCEELTQRFNALELGDPREDNLCIGPIARKDLRDQLHDQVMRTVNAGARCLTGGERPNMPGYYYPPTLLVDVTPGMAAFEEETFGPVLAICKADDIDDAFALANNTEYGLGASIWTSNDISAKRAAIELQAGQVAINGIVKTDPRLPSGGIGKSGYGRELGPHGIREFVNIKQIWAA